jgi:hypothetical protein
MKGTPSFLFTGSKKIHSNIISSKPVKITFSAACIYCFSNKDLLKQQ